MPWGLQPSCSYIKPRLREPRSERSLRSTELSLGGSMVSRGRWAPRRRKSRHSIQGVLRRLPAPFSRLSSRWGPPQYSGRGGGGIGTPPLGSGGSVLGGRSSERGDVGAPSSRYSVTSLKDVAALSPCCSLDSLFSREGPPGPPSCPSGWQLRASSIDSAKDFTCWEAQKAVNQDGSINSVLKEKKMEPKCCTK